jgi:3-hydroxy-9,10-secoandrosta-1,3,5(10)-triene-9,17-dione monooxygenase reductase component
MGHFATGVTVVSAVTADGTPIGSTANAVSSVSLDPPLVLVCLRRESQTLRVLTEARRFAVNVLEAGQAGIAQRFAHSSTGLGWAGVPHRSGLLSGAPLIDATVATIEAEVHQIADGGDHRIVVGRVLDLAHPDEHVAPLLFYRGAYAGLERRDVGEG